jgi:hypothetical protein
MSPSPDASSPADAASPAGSCYGYAISSSLPFAYLRDGGFGDRLEVTESDAVPQVDGDPTFRWTRSREEELEGCLYVEDDRYLFWSDREGWYEIDPDGPSITVPAGADPIDRERRLWGVPAVLCFLRRGDLSLHAAAVQVGDGAILMAGPGRFGKTTLAGGFLRAGYRVLSEDISCCRSEDHPVVFPGPAVLRVRQDTYEGVDFPGTTPIAEEFGRVHLRFDDQLRGDGAPLPIKGVVFLRATEEAMRFERLDPTTALPDLWTLSWKLPVDDDLRRCFEGTAALAGSVPVWNLHRPMRFEELDQVVAGIVETCG